MAKVVFLDAQDLDDEPLKQVFSDYTSYPQTAPSQVLARCQGAVVILMNKIIISAEVIKACPSLKLIAVAATGVNNVDLKAAQAAGVQVRNVPGYSTASVAQLTMTFLLNWATQMHRYAPEASLWAKSSSFTRLIYPIRELAGLKLGIVGAGQIGQQVGHMAETFGMDVRTWARPNSSSTHTLWRRLPLREFFETSDVISLHCPLTDETKQMINRETLGWMKPGSFLINTGRGALIDELALKEALISGHLGGAGLDVLSTEPPPVDHPLLDSAIPNLMITPHIGWGSFEARERLVKEVLENIQSFLDGKDRNRMA